MRARFLQRLSALQALVWGQYSLRLLLRGIWLALALNLAASALDRMFGWSLHRLMTLYGGWLVAAGVLAAAGFAFPRPRWLAWRIDRRLGLQEQISTALQVVQRGEDGPVADALVQDAARLLGQSTRRVVLRGWYLGPEVISLLVVLALGVMAGLDRGLLLADAPLPLERAELPALIQDPRADTIFPAGIPGLKNAGSSAQSPAPGQDAAARERTRAALSRLGEQLQQEAATHALAAALQQNDLEQAAQQLEALTGRLPDLQSATRADIARALEEAADQIGDPASNPLAARLKEAAVSIQKDRSSDAARALQGLASDLRNLSAAGLQVAKSGPGASIGPGGQGMAGSSQPFTRLQGGAGQSIPIGELSPLLSPDQVTAPDAQALPLRLDQPASQGGGSSLYLTPFQFSWTWRDVVSKYFSR